MKTSRLGSVWSDRYFHTAVKECSFFNLCNSRLAINVQTRHCKRRAFNPLFLLRQLYSEDMVMNTKSSLQRCCSNKLVKRGLLEWSKCTLHLFNVKFSKLGLNSEIAQDTFWVNKQDNPKFIIQCKIYKGVKAFTVYLLCW